MAPELSLHGSITNDHRFALLSAVVLAALLLCSVEKKIAALLG